MPHRAGTVLPCLSVAPRILDVTSHLHTSIVHPALNVILVLNVEPLLVVLCVCTLPGLESVEDHPHVDSDKDKRREKLGRIQTEHCGHNHTAQTITHGMWVWLAVCWTCGLCYVSKIRGCVETSSHLSKRCTAWSTWST